MGINYNTSIPILKNYSYGGQSLQITVVIPENLPRLDNHNFEGCLRKFQFSYDGKSYRGKFSRFSCLLEGNGELSGVVLGYGWNDINCFNGYH